jgi:hypothetical protein
MISDALRAAAAAIDHFKRTCPECYCEVGFSTRLSALRESIDRMLNEIDSGPIFAAEIMARVAGKDVDPSGR